jgi:dihydroorotate dehydrogenase (NAD+) catalytic subunit
LSAAGARVVASIWGRTVDDYELAAKALADAPDEVVAVEVNISCPNTEAGNAMFGHSVEATSQVLEATAACGRPRWAKLSPNVGPGLVGIARAAADAGAEAVTLVNTYLGLVIDPVSGQARLGNGGGGVSGPAVRPLAVRAVADVRAALPDLPIVGVGGIATAPDVVEFARAGANAVQIGTASFADPRTVGRLATDLARWCANQGVRRYVDLIATARW